MNEEDYKIEIVRKLAALEANYKSLDKKVDLLSSDFKFFTSNCFEHFKNDVYNKMEKLKGISPVITIILSLFSAVITGLAIYVLTK